MTEEKVRLHGSGLRPCSSIHPEDPICTEACRPCHLNPSYPFCTPELRAPGSRVLSSFFLRRRDRFSGKDLHHFFLIRPIRFSSFESPEGLLHDPILKGVEGDHTHSATPFEEGPSFSSTCSQILQFMIDPDTKGLKGSRCRVESSRLEPPGDGLINDLT